MQATNCDLISTDGRNMTCSFTNQQLLELICNTAVRSHKLALKGLIFTHKFPVSQKLSNKQKPYRTFNIGTQTGNSNKHVTILENAMVAQLGRKLTTEIQCRVQNTSPLASILNQINPIHSFMSHYLIIHFSNLSSHP